VFMHGITIGISLLVSLILIRNSQYGAILVGLLFLPLFIIKFEYIFPLVLIVRSSLDIFTDIGVYIGPMKLNIPAVISIFIDMAGLLYLGFLFQRDKKIPFDDISKSFSIWLFFLFFWIFWAYHQFGPEGLIGVREWIRLFSLFIIFLLSLQLVRMKGYEYLINSTILSLIIPLSVGYYQIFSQIFLLSMPYRIYATLAHPNVLSLYLVFFMAITMWKLKFAKKKVPWLGLQLIILIALLNTFSIGGMVMICVLFVMIVLKEFELKNKLLILSFSIILFFAFINTDIGQKRLAELKTTPSLVEVIEGDAVTNSFTWRIVNWKMLLGIWIDKPMMGFGLNTTGLANPWHNYAAHNDFLRFLVETGVIGFIIYIWFLFKIWVNLRAQYQSCTNAREKYLAMMIEAVFIAWMIGSIVDNYITATTFQFYFWALLACVMGNKINEKLKYQSSDINNLSY